MIKIDLNDLAKADMIQLADFGECYYTSPCIIGLLMTPDQRMEAEEGDDRGDTGIDVLIEAEIVELPADQQEDAKAMQRAFDYNDRDTLATLVAKYGAKL